MWGHKHAWSALFAALTAYINLLDLTIDGKKIGFGIGIHSGGCLVYRAFKDGMYRDFIYGIVANSAARLESYTKQLAHTPLLLSGNFKDVLKNEDHDKFSKIENSILSISKKRFLIHDEKPNGHKLYTIKNLNKNSAAIEMLKLTK